MSVVRPSTYRMASTGVWATTCWDAGTRGACLELDTPEHLDFVQRAALEGESFVDDEGRMLSGTEFLAFIDPLEWSFGEHQGADSIRIADSLAPFLREQPVVCPNCHFEGYVTASVHPDSVTFDCPDCGQTVTYDDDAEIPDNLSDKTAGIMDYFDVVVLHRGDEVMVVEYGSPDLTAAVSEAERWSVETDTVSVNVINRGTGSVFWANGVPNADGRFHASEVDQLLSQDKQSDYDNPCTKCGAANSLVWAGDLAQCAACGTIDHSDEPIEFETVEEPEADDEVHILLATTASKTAEVIHCATNWTMDGLPIEGGFAVEGAEELVEEEPTVQAAVVPMDVPLVWPDTHPGKIFGRCPECHVTTDLIPLELEHSEFYRCSACGKDVSFDALTSWPMSASLKEPGEFTAIITALADADLLEAGEMIKEQMGGLSNGERTALNQALGEVAVEVDRRRLPVAALEDGSWVDVPRPFCSMVPGKGMTGGPFPTFRTAVTHRAEDSVAVPVDMASQFRLESGEKS